MFSEIGSEKIIVTNKDFTQVIYLPILLLHLEFPVGLASADTDGLWTLAGVPKEVSVTDLVADDYASTFVKYDGEGSSSCKGQLQSLKQERVNKHQIRDELTEVFPAILFVL